MIHILEAIDRIVWGIPALLLIAGVGIYLSCRTGFVQIRFLPRALKSLVSKLRSRSTDTGLSSYQALCTALAATVGTGNLAGVAGAIAIGGPGAVFWMWICGILGMVTKYAEAVLAVRFRIRNINGQWVGGPMYLIEQGLGKRWRWLAIIYSCMGILASFGVGNATQINAINSGVASMVSAFGGTLHPMVRPGIGVIFAVLTVGILSGGMSRIGRVAEMLVPAASLFYLLLCCAALTRQYDEIAVAMRSIFTGAFSPGAVTGGAVGSVFMTVRIGASRGVFTNEAGMGTAAMAHGAATVSHPAEQGMMGILEVFLDTIIICTMTALVILTSGVNISFGTDSGMTLTIEAFSAVLGNWVSIPLNLSLCCFATATVIGWGMYAICCAEFLFGRGIRKYLIGAHACVAVIGAVSDTGMVWIIADIINGCMAIPNLIAILGLSPCVIALTKNYTLQFGRMSADGGVYENINQCKPMRAVSHAEVSSAGCKSKKRRAQDLPSEYWPT